MNSLDDRFFANYCKDFPVELKIIIDELKRKDFDDERLLDICYSIHQRIILDQSSTTQNKEKYELTRNFLECIEGLPFFTSKDKNISVLSKDLFVEIKNFKTAEKYINDQSIVYKRKPKLINCSDLNLDIDFFGLAPTDLSPGKPGLLIETVLELHSFTPLIAFWKAEKLFQDERASQQIFKMLLKKEDDETFNRSKHVDPYFNFSIDLSQMLLLFVVTDANKIPHKVKSKLIQLDSPKMPEEKPKTIIKHDDQPTTRQSLGRVGSIGDFYDARKDSFCGKNLFVNKTPDKLLHIEPHNHNQSVMREMFGDSFEEKFSLLDIEDELKASYFENVSFSIDFRGNAKFLLHRRENEEQEVYSIFYKLSTQTIRLDFDQMKNFLDFNHSEIFPDATHIVTGIEYGGIAVFTIASDNDGNDQEIFREKLRQTLGSIKNDFIPSEIPLKSDYQLFLYHDFDNDPYNNNILRDLDEARDLYRKFPLKVLSFNNGIGVPIKFHLQPIGFFQQFDSLSVENAKRFYPVSMQEIKKLVRMFEDFELNKIDLHPIADLFNMFGYCVSKESIAVIETQMQMLKIFEKETLKNVEEYLLKIRNGNTINAKSVVDRYQESGNNREQLKKQLVRLKSDIKRVKYVKRLAENGVVYLKLNQKLDVVIKKQNYEDCYIFAGYFSETDSSFKEYKDYFDKILEYKCSQKFQKIFIDFHIHHGDLQNLFENKKLAEINFTVGNQIWRCVSKNAMSDVTKLDFYPVNIREEFKVTEAAIIEPKSGGCNIM